MMMSMIISLMIFLIPDQVEEIIGMINDLGLQVHEKAPDLDTLMLESQKILMI